MTTNSPSQRDSLDLAREAYRSGDYAAALEHYDHFFEHALDDDPHSLYGVRLSYCLSEWAKLGEQFPLALERLRLKKESALRLLEASRDPERFHDYVAICRYLKCPDQPIQQFLAYHLSDRDLSQSIVRFIWDALVASKQWAVCGCYIANGLQHCEDSLGRFDEAMSVCDSDPSPGGDEFANQIEGWYVRDVTNLVLVLRNSGRSAEAETVLARVENDCTERGRLKMLGVIHAQLALKPALACTPSASRPGGPSS
jgi:hypothetical protein